jgi:hypothetical protein
MTTPDNSEGDMEIKKSDREIKSPYSLLIPSSPFLHRRV